MAGLESIDGGGPWYICPNGPMVLGEAPIYRASDSTLHWVDCLTEPTLFILKVDPDSGDAIGEARTIPLEDSVTVAFFRKNKPGKYIAAYYQGVCFMDEQTGKLEVVKEIIPTDQRNELRFNDGGIDAKGRFWLAEIDNMAMPYGPNGLPASYGTPRGRLWRYDPDGSLHLMIDKGIICGNGLGWSPDNKTSKISPDFSSEISLLSLSKCTSMTQGPCLSTRTTLTWRRGICPTDVYWLIVGHPSGSRTGWLSSTLCTDCIYQLQTVLTRRYRP